MKTNIDIYVDDRLVAISTIERPITKIGLLASADLRLQDHSVSRMHATIEMHDNGQLAIYDLGSVSGTFVNGQKIEHKKIQIGDRIKIGKFTIVVTSVTD